MNNTYMPHRNFRRYPPRSFSALNGYIRETYVDTAIQAAWVAEGYWRFKRYDKAEEYAKKARTSLDNADRLCSNSNIPTIGGFTGTTSSIWPCANTGSSVSDGQILVWANRDFGCGLITLTIK